MPRDQRLELDATTDSLDCFRQLVDDQGSLLDAIDRRAANVAECAMLLLGVIFTALLVASQLDAPASAELGVFSRTSLLAGLGGHFPIPPSTVGVAALVTLLSAYQLLKGVRRTDPS